MMDPWELIVGHCTANELQIRLAFPSREPSRNWQGFVRGPFCEFSTTLTADFPLQPISSSLATAAVLDARVLEPCYWTPQLPFYYQFHLRCETSEAHCVLQSGVRALSCDGRHLRLQGKRIVLRGARCPSPDEQQIRLARESETALWVEGVDTVVSGLASRWGVPLVVDLRRCPGPWQQTIQKLQPHPAVFVVALDSEQLSDSSELELASSPTLVAQVIDAHATRGVVARTQPDLLIVELEDDQLPPSWLVDCEIPVAAMRSDQQDRHPGVRRRCDQLQASLAPQFDLAGYFV